MFIFIVNSFFEGLINKSAHAKAEQKISKILQILYSLRQKEGLGSE